MPETVAREPGPCLRGPGGRPLRVVHLTTIDASLAILLGTELEYDVESGAETFGLSAPGPYVDRLEALGVRHLALPSLSRRWSPRLDAAAACELYAALRQIRPDVLHTHNPKTGVLGRVVARVARVPVVVNTCHGLWATPEDRLRKRVAVYAAEVIAAAFSDAELYQNTADNTTLARWVRQSKCQVVGNGTDLQRFRPDPAARQVVRAELGLSDDDLLVGAVGRMVTEKGVAEFVAVAEALRDRATFVWVGPADPDKPDAVAAAGDAVRFLGERTDMESIHNALDVFVLPSYREGFSRSAMEAAACGRAMVLSDIRGCREVGSHEQELLLCPRGNSDALESAVARLLGDEQLRNRLGRAARARAMSEFDQRRVAATSMRTYQEAAHRRGLGWS